MIRGIQPRYAMSLVRSPRPSSSAPPTRRHTGCWPSSPQTRSWPPTRYGGSTGRLPSVAGWLSEPSPKLRERYPDSPVGWANAADVYLRWAESSERFGWAPFQVRQWRRRALDLYHGLRSNFGGPSEVEDLMTVVLDTPTLLAIAALGTHPNASLLINAQSSQ